MVAVLHGAVVGGGLELAAAAHVRVAERSAYYALPEGSRGIYVGGGGSVRLPRLIGVARMMDMMLTGRTYSAEEGQAMGLTTYLVEPGKGFAKGLELAHRIAGNAPLTNFAHHAGAAAHRRERPGGRLAMEALMAAIAQADAEAKARLQGFLEKRGPKVTRTKSLSYRAGAKGRVPGSRMDDVRACAGWPGPAPTRTSRNDEVAHLTARRTGGRYCPRQR